MKEYIIWHCSDSDFGCANVIDLWHRGRGFDEIGYHAVICNGKPFLSEGYHEHLDGQIEMGRLWSKSGAHAKGLNQDAMGLCLIGKHKFTIKQITSAYAMTKLWMARYGIPIDNVIGHYEIGNVKPELATHKTCPNINMEQVRAFLRI